MTSRRSTTMPILEIVKSSLEIQVQAYLPVVGSSVIEADLDNSSLIEPKTNLITNTIIKGDSKKPLYSSSGMVDILIIPLTMSPVLAILIVVINRTRYKVEYYD